MKQCIPKHVRERQHPIDRVRSDRNVKKIAGIILFFDNLVAVKRYKPQEREWQGQQGLRDWHELVQSFADNHFAKFCQARKNPMSTFLDIFNNDISNQIPLPFKCVVVRSTTFVFFPRADEMSAPFCMMFDHCGIQKRNSAEFIEFICPFNIVDMDMKMIRLLPVCFEPFVSNPVNPRKGPTRLNSFTIDPNISAFVEIGPSTLRLLLFATASSRQTPN